MRIFSVSYLKLASSKIYTNLDPGRIWPNAKDNKRFDNPVAVALCDLFKGLIPPLVRTPIACGLQRGRSDNVRITSGSPLDRQWWFAERSVIWFTSDPNLDRYTIDHLRSIIWIAGVHDEACRDVVFRVEFSGSSLNRYNCTYEMH